MNKYKRRSSMTTIEKYDMVELNSQHLDFPKGTRLHIKNIIENEAFVDVLGENESRTIFVDLKKLNIIKKGPVLLLDSQSINGIVFSIADKKVKLSPESIESFKNFLSEYTEWYEHWKPYLEWYKDYNEDTIKKRLNDEKQSEYFDGQYSVGENFAAFTHDSFGERNFCDNGKSADRIQKLYEDKYGNDHTLIFDPEAGYCYVYTKDIEEAVRFKMLVYNEIIKPVLDKIK